jgi:hypothetical protein
VLRVSDNRRFLVRDDGTPFFYLADIAWALFQRLNLEEIHQYLADRAAKGFTVIQAVALSKFDGLRAPNRSGDLPFHDNDPLRPNDAYFRHLMTYYPLGVDSSSVYSHDDAGLDFNTLQSCHLTWDRDNYNLIAKDYDRIPTKPCVDSEPNYEDMPVNMSAANGYCTAYDARKATYWALFAGAHGHTYGANGVFQFWDGSQSDRFGARHVWREAIALLGASQMQYTRPLLESRPFLERIPDQSLLASDPETGTDHVQATRTADGSYALVDSASGQPFVIDLSRLTSQTIAAHWYDPHTGTAHDVESFPSGGLRTFEPPTQGRDNDWVLVLDDQQRGFEVPEL